MKARHITGCVAGVVALVLTGPAFAQEDPYEPAPEQEEEPMPAPEEEDPFEEAPEQEDPLAEPPEDEPMGEEEPLEPAPPIEPELEEPSPAEQAQNIMQDIGVGVSVGGGVQGFTEEQARDLADVGGSWEGRLSVGTKFPIGVEAAYLGSAQDIDALGLDEDAVLVGNGLEGVARVNVPLIEQLTPYALAGIGWTNYSLANDDFNTSNVRDDDNVGYVPLGAGVTYRVGRAAFDLRGTWRGSFEDQLVDVEPGEDEPSLDTWGVTGKVGFEF